MSKPKRPPCVCASGFTKTGVLDAMRTRTGCNQLDCRVAELGANSAYCHIVVLQVENCTVNHFMHSTESLSFCQPDFFFSFFIVKFNFINWCFCLSVDEPPLW